MLNPGSVVPGVLLLLFLLAFAAGLVTAWQVVLGRKRGAAASLGWVVTLLFLPFFGLLLYYVFGRRRISRTRRRYGDARRVGAGFYLPRPSSPTSTGRSTLDLVAYGPRGALVRLAETLSARPLTGGNVITLYHRGSDTLQAIEKAVREARRHVHLEYYIFRADGTGRRLLDALREAAERGVQVRLLVDDVGTGALDDPSVSALRRSGGEIARFNPVWGAQALHHVHLRNHRKIVVVDGEISFAGSQNVGDEYAGMWRGMTWKDIHLRVAGPATRCLQEIFWDDWCYATRDARPTEGLFPDVSPGGDQWVQVVDSGPDREASAIHHLLFSAIATAEARIDLVTPYFIPDAEILTALKVAALRGVKVRILVPGRSDHPLVKAAGRWYYEELLEVGVRIWEYQRGMLHAKTAVVDGWWSMIGTANVDQRSFHLNFEVCTVVYGHAMARRLEREFDEDLHHALPIDAEWLDRIPRRQRIGSAFARMLSPLL